MRQKILFSPSLLIYSFWAVAKSTAGRRNPSDLLATQHAPGVFFYVVAFAHLFSARWFINCLAYQAMVAQAGQPLGWPVSNKAGIPTPVWATTHKRRNFGGSNDQYLLEAAIMATTLITSRQKIVFLFAAIRRNDPHAQIHMLRTLACNEYAARRQLAREYILSFAGRLPTTGGCYEK